MALGPLDTKMRMVASSLITKYGKTISIVTEVVGTYDTAGGDVDVSESVQKTKGVFVKPEQLGFGTNLAQSGSSYLMVAAHGLKKVPDPADSVEIDGVTSRIVNVEAIRSGEQVCVYLLDIGS